MVAHTSFDWGNIPLALSIWAYANIYGRGQICAVGCFANLRISCCIFISGIENISEGFPELWQKNFLVSSVGSRGVRARLYLHSENVNDE